MSGVVSKDRATGRLVELTRSGRANRDESSQLLQPKACSAQALRSNARDYFAGGSEPFRVRVFAIPYS